MDKNVKDIKHTRHIYIRVHSMRNGENYKMQNIEGCKGGLKLGGIVTKNVGETYLNTIMKYIMVRFEN